MNAEQVVSIYDTTLRDGTQCEGISLSVEDKFRIAQRLDSLGVGFIEGGFPGSNPKDAEFFARAQELELHNAALVAFGSTRRAGNRPSEDPGLRALCDANTKWCTIFGKSSVAHAAHILRTSLQENLRMIEDSVEYLTSQGRHVIYDAEHFFDGYREDRDYALSTLQAAQRGGARVIVLCDTNGGAMPWEVEQAVTAVRRHVDCPLGIHAHNDGGCAVANSLAAVRAGAQQVQGTINGYGERCGNADLCSVIPNIELKLGLQAVRPSQLTTLHDTARFVADVANLRLEDRSPYVGTSAFAHKGGVHVSAMRRDPNAYQHIDPALVGNRSRVLVSELSGRSNVHSKAQEFGLSLDGGADQSVLDHIKAEESRGYAFEAAEASIALMVRRRSPGYQPPFRLLDYRVVVGPADGKMGSEATVRLQIGSTQAHTAGAGRGPVEALDQALRKAIGHALDVASIRLTDYKVRIVDGRQGTGAVTRVLVESARENEAWTTVGASSNIIEASCLALVDAFEYGLGHKNRAHPQQQRELAS